MARNEDAMTQAAKTRTNALPQWRGFNLLEMFSTTGTGDFQEDDFRWIADWGFDFVRIPMCYLLWCDGDWWHLKESMLQKVDRVVALGNRYHLHVDLNFHRAPGYCINSDPAEPLNLWKDKEAEDAFCFQWQTFARRYQGISSDKLSFNLVNEPLGYNDNMSREDHSRVIRRATLAIREVDPDRLIIADGVRAGNDASPELADLGIGQSCRAYLPMGISHYQAPWTFSWMDPSKVPPPAWPGGWNFGKLWTRADLEAHYRPWLDLVSSGVGVHCGEGGAYNKTPHDVVLRWLDDVMGILAAGGIGWALWNFRGSFGVIDSGRQDVHYTPWHAHQLDEPLLKILQSH